MLAGWRGMFWVAAGGLLDLPGICSWQSRAGWLSVKDKPLIALCLRPALPCPLSQAILPVALGFAGGCMIWIVFAELLPDAFTAAPPKQVRPALAVRALGGRNAPASY